MADSLLLILLAAFFSIIDPAPEREKPKPRGTTAVAHAIGRLAPAPTVA
jgi:hypothetical protein